MFGVRPALAFALIFVLFLAGCANPAASGKLTLTVTKAETVACNQFSSSDTSRCFALTVHVVNNDAQDFSNNLFAWKSVTEKGGVFDNKRTTNRGPDAIASGSSGDVVTEFDITDGSAIKTLRYDLGLTKAESRVPPAGTSTADSGSTSAPSSGSGTPTPTPSSTPATPASSTPTTPPPTSPSSSSTSSSVVTVTVTTVSQVDCSVLASATSTCVSISAHVKNGGSSDFTNSPIAWKITTSKGTIFDASFSGSKGPDAIAAHSEGDVTQTFEISDASRATILNYDYIGKTAKADVPTYAGAPTGSTTPSPVTNTGIKLTVTSIAPVDCNAYSSNGGSCFVATIHVRNDKSSNFDNNLYAWKAVTQKGGVFSVDYASNSGKNPDGVAPGYEFDTKWSFDITDATPIAKIRYDYFGSKAEANAPASG